MYQIQWCSLYYINFIILILQIFINSVHNFNVDLHSYVKHTYNPGSMYGFSIAMHKSTESGSLKSWLIIGAPKANLTDHYTRLGLISPGVVFRCQVDADNRCQPVLFDQQGNKYNTNNEQIDTKSYQWFGATVASGGIDKPIVACAPRYVFHGMQPSKVERIEPVGTCYTATDFQKFKEYSPCRTNFWGYHRQGYCQAGFSAALSQAGDRLFIGAPGSWYWQGQIYSINTNSEFQYKPGYYQPFGEAGQIYSLDPTSNTSQVYSTRESSSLDDDSYLGYSMAVGKLTGNSEHNDVAVGMPRGENLLGKIAIFSWSMENLYNITGKQIGAYFGYSLCVVDVDGDNLDDLIIGAPMYTVPNNDEKYDVGRVYIIFQGVVDKFQKAVFRDGFKSRSRFGTALTSLGDINNDGYKDFAVGAPYDGKFSDGGAVYIYHGSKTGPSLEPVQIIYAEELYLPYPRTFGFSLSGGMDLDENGYTDLAVGAYESDTVFFFKSRPVVTVQSNIKFFDYDGIREINAIDIEKNKKCQRRGQNVPCARLLLCINYDASKVSNNPNLNFDITYKLDVKAKIHRMFSVSDTNIIKKQIPLNITCTEDLIYINNGIQDKLSKMQVEVEYDIIDRSRNIEYIRRDTRQVPPPIVDQRNDIGRKSGINIQKNCGEDNVCIPDLYLNVSAVDKYVLDDKKQIVLNVTVKNRGEDAFETKYFIDIPKGLEYARTLNKKEANIQVTCTSIAKNDIVKCDIGNPFVSHGTAEFQIVFDVVGKEGYPSSYDFYMQVNSTNEEDKYAMIDNIFKKSIKLLIETDFNINGNTPSSFGYYKAENYKKFSEVKHESEIGPEVIHAYNFLNNGSAEIGKVIVTIAIPTRTLSDKPLMYVLNPPEINGNIKCIQTPRPNEKNFEYDQELSHKSYLAQIGAISNHISRKKFDDLVNTYPSSHHTTSTVIYNKFYTEEEKRQFDQDNNRDSPGDASLTHSQRAKEVSSSSGQHSLSTKYPPSSSSWADLESRNQPVNSLHKATQGGLGFQAGALDLGYHQNGQGSFQSGHNFREPQSGSSNYQNSKEYHTGKFQNGSASGIGIGGRFESVNVGRGHQLSREHQLGGGYQGSSGVQYQGGSRGDHEYGTIGSYSPRLNYSYSSNWNNRGSGSDSYNFNNDFQRTKRQIRQKSPQEEERIYADLRAAVNCTVTHCFLMECEISRLDSKEDAWISIRTRFVAETLAEIASNNPVNISTMAAAAIMHSPFLTDKPHKNVIKTHEIVYTAIPEPEAKDDIIPLWVVVLSACAGTLILLLLAFLLYKCGFFNRSRPSDSQERQPLNRNGNYHGDEHL